MAVTWRTHLLNMKMREQVLGGCWGGQEHSDTICSPEKCVDRLSKRVNVTCDAMQSMFSQNKMIQQVGIKTSCVDTNMSAQNKNNETAGRRDGHFKLW